MKLPRRDQGGREIITSNEDDQGTTDLRLRKERRGTSSMTERASRHHPAQRACMSVAVVAALTMLGAPSRQRSVVDQP
jgi:hypothetical protein